MDLRVRTNRWSLRHFGVGWWRMVVQKGWCAYPSIYKFLQRCVAIPTGFCNMRVAGYVRVSTEQQLDEGSHGKQRLRLEAWTDRDGHDTDIYCLVE